MNDFEVNTISPKVQYDRKELIRIFDEANNMLRGDGLRAGIERFGEFANILFLKLISESEQIKQESAIVFARSYSGREKDFKIEDADSVFVYSLMPEKDIAKLFKIIELDNSQISFVGDLVDTRNEMAHASGKFKILTEDSYDVQVNSVITSMKNVHKGIVPLIRKWYGQVLISFCKGEYEGYDEPKDFITEQMIHSFKLSTNELLICNEMSVSSLITEHRGYGTKLKEFKKVLADYCQEMGYI